MKKIFNKTILFLAMSVVLVSCEFDNGDKQDCSDTILSSDCPKESLLYQTIYDFTKMIDSASNDKTINILGVYNKKKEDGDYIVLGCVPDYSCELDHADSLIVSYAIVNKWLVCLILTPDVFNKYKSSFTFVDPNQYPQYQKSFEGAFEPITWNYRFQHDSLVFVNREKH